MTTDHRVATYTPRSGVLAEVDTDRSHCRLWAIKGADTLDVDPEVTAFGFVQSGSGGVDFGEHHYPLLAGQYVCLPGDGGSARISGQGPGATIVGVAQSGVRGFFHLGGPIESAGRLRYIDGCTDSLLIPPVVYGEPCLNLLHIPPETQQSAHTHPSFRAGIIVSGAGVCVTPSRRIPLQPGLIFMIDPDTLHSFHTDREALLVIAYHPDSDFGPTHEVHPMINRTVLPR